MMEIGLSLGSNLDDRLKNLKQAKEKISGLPEVEIIKNSPVYETEPVGVRAEFENKQFLNAVLIINCKLEIKHLSSSLRAIETEMGRTRDNSRNNPRIIDIDIIYAGQMTIRQPDLIIPHPRWKERRFVLQPLADVRPELLIPGEKRPVKKLLLSLPETPKVVPYKDRW